MRQRMVHVRRQNLPGGPEQFRKFGGLGGVSGRTDMVFRSEMVAEIADGVAVVDVIDEALAGGQAAISGVQIARGPEGHAALVACRGDIFGLGAAERMAGEIDRVRRVADRRQILFHGPRKSGPAERLPA